MSDATAQPDPAETAEAVVDETDLAEEGELREFSYRLGKNLTRRLDQYLVDRIGYLSRNEIQRLITDGFVKLNGKTTKASSKPRENDIVTVSAPPPKLTTLIPENIPLDVLFEDEWMLALNKQTNLCVHPSRGQWSGTLANGLLHYSRELSKVNGDWRPGILHRLDRNTTGVILIAKVDEAHWRLARQFENRTIQKTYMAITHGVPALQADVINLPIGRDRYIREKQAVRNIETGAREAVTRYEVQKTIETVSGQTVYTFEKSSFANDQHYRTPGGKFSLIKLHPKTGRTHQLRVHLSHIGVPIVGDTMYGGQTFREVDAAATDHPPLIFARQALHAHEITFTHPVTLAQMTITAPLPADMQQLWATIQRAAGGNS
ncbi:MAG TPA: RluA family pseudouridine synthase [Tepidisphaeraceae bacterium]